MAALTVALGACSSAETPSAEAPASAPAGAEAEAPESPAPGATTGVTQISDIFGPACSQVPTEGEGSAQGMVDDPVATAASNNPLLTTLTKAATAANLVDTLNSAPAITVFAPADPAFAALETQNPGITTQLTTAPDVASPNGQLAKILTYHVVGQRYDKDGLLKAGTTNQLSGGTVSIKPSGDTITVTDAKNNTATVLCGNIPTKNATVFVIDKVMMPGS